MNHYFIAGCWVFLVCSCFSLDYAMGGNSMSDENIQAIINHVSDSDEDLDKREQKLLSLLPQCEEAKDKGKVLAAIARIYSEPVTPQTGKVVDYCSRAVQYPLEILETCDVYMMWGKALETDKGLSSDVKPKGDAQKTACAPYIKAMDLVLQNLKVKKKMPPPAVGKFDATLKDPSYQELKKRHEDQMEQRRYATEQNKLVDYKRMLREKIVSFYGEADSPVLEADVREIIHDGGKAARVCDALKETN